MKKFISGFIAGALIFSMLGVFAAVTYVAKPLDYKVVVNGEEFTSDPPPLEVDGRTYLPLRAMGDALGVPVNWNEELRQAEVGMISSNIDANEVKNFIIGDVWNDGFWWIRNYLDGSYTDYMDMYIETFADSADEKFDIRKIVSHILETKPVIELYNTAFKNNEKWGAFYKEYNRLYELIEKESYSASSFDTTFFTKVRDDFCDSI